jgi:hypothetical protein
LEFGTEYTQESEQEMDTTNQKPEPKLMEVESQPKIEWLCNKKLWVSDFEFVLDGLVGDGTSIIPEFVDWESSGPTYRFNELRDVYAERPKCVLIQSIYIFLVLLILEGNQRKYGPPGQLNWKALISKDIPMI